MQLTLPKFEDLQSLALSDIAPGSVTDFDVYLVVGGHVVIYANSMYKWEEGEIARLRREGHLQVFHLKSKIQLVNAYKQISLISKIDESLSPEERINNITSVAAEFNKTLFQNELSKAVLKKGQSIAEAMVRCIEEDMHSVTALTQLADHDMYTYYHSGRVAAYATALAIQMGLKDSYSLTELSLGCLMHDIGKARIDLTILNKEGRLTSDEYDVIKKHPEHGIDMVHGAILTAVPKEIILHHHERMDGSGYPYGLDGRKLLEEVKIASFSDCFDALTTNRPYQKARSHYDALNFIKDKLLHALDPEVFEALISILHGKSIDKATVKAS